MTLLHQPPEKSKEQAASKPSGESKPGPATTQEKTAPTKDIPGKTGQEKPLGKENAPPVDVQPLNIPTQPPPGAKIEVKPKDQHKNFEIGSILQPALLLIGILTLGAIILAWLKKNRDRSTGAATLSANDQLSAFRESMEQGDMTDDEYKKVKALLAEKIRKPSNPVTTAPAPTTSPVPTENQP